MCVKLLRTIVILAETLASQFVYKHERTLSFWSAVLAVVLQKAATIKIEFGSRRK